MHQLLYHSFLPSSTTTTIPWGSIMWEIFFHPLPPSNIPTPSLRPSPLPVIISERENEFINICWACQECTSAPFVDAVSVLLVLMPPPLRTPLPHLHTRQSSQNLFIIDIHYRKTQSHSLCLPLSIPLDVVVRKVVWCRRWMCLRAHQGLC